MYWQMMDRVKYISNELRKYQLHVILLRKPFIYLQSKYQLKPIYHKLQ